jgi:hypothetical protein
MGEKEGDDLAGDGAEVAVAADAGDPLQCGGGGDGVGGVGVECRTGRDAGGWVAGWCSGRCGIEEGVEATGFCGSGKSSGVGEHVLGGGDDGVGAGGGEFDPVGEVEAGCDEVRGGLFSVLRAQGGEEGVEAGEVAGDGDGVDAGVEGAEKSGHGAASGATKGSDAVGVYLGTGLQVVDSADAVPGEGAGEGVADEGGLEAGFAVLTGGGFEKGLAGVVGVGVLEALALADGVVGEDGKAVAGKGTGEDVVGGFAGEAVAGSYDDGREFLLGVRVCAGFGVREIEESGYGEVGLGFIEDLFDAEAFGLRGAEGFCVEGCLFGEAADESEDFLADFALAGFGLGAGGDGGDGGAAGSGFFGGDVVEVVGELGAADVGWAVGILFPNYRSRKGYRRLCCDEGCSKKSRGGQEMESSHRAALIHRGEREVNRWSYQFEVPCDKAWLKTGTCV